jgi:hypothetical protein
LDDTLDYFRARSTDTTDVDGSTEHQVTWNNEDEKDSAFTHAANSATITLDEGIYLVAYNIRANTGTTGTRKTITTKATLGGTDVPQSYGYSYMRGSNGCNDGAATSLFLISVDSDNTDLEIEVYTPLDEASATTNLVSNESAISIVQFPSTVERLIAYSNNDQACETFATLIHETEEEETSAFDHNTTTGVVTIQEAGDYLFGFSGGAERTGTTTSTRGYFSTLWNKNAILLKIYGVGGHYNRNDQASTGTFRGGNMAATLFHSLAVNDIIDIRATFRRC